MSGRRILTIFVKELNELFRDSKMRTIMLISPIIQLLIFGYAATYDIREIPVGILDHDKSILSRKLISSLEESKYFKVTHSLSSTAETDTLLTAGDVWCVLEIPRDFSEAISKGNGTELGISIDASNSSSATITAGYLSGVVAQLNDELLRERRERLAGTEPGIKVGLIDNRIRVLFNPDLESRNFNVPAVVVQILVIVTLLLTSMAIVKEKEFGTMEQLIVTPIRSSELMIGKALPYALIGMIDVTVVCAVAVFYFDVPLRGSIPLLVGSSLIFMLSTLAIGLLISTISTTQQQAMMSAFFFMMPAILLSGFAFPIENMPVPIQYLTYLNPLRYFIVIIRAIFLKGAETNVLIGQIIPLIIIGTATLTLAALRFRKRIR